MKKISSFILSFLLLVFTIRSWNAHAQQKNPAKTEINFSTKEYKQVLALAKKTHKKNIC